MAPLRGFYCSACGATYRSTGSGIITCQMCGHLGLRGFEGRLRRAYCTKSGCSWKGWDDGGVNDDLGNHLRRGHLDRGHLGTEAL